MAKVDMFNLLIKIDRIITQDYNTLESKMLYNKLGY